MAVARCSTADCIQNHRNQKDYYEKWSGDNCNPNREQWFTNKGLDDEINQGSVKWGWKNKTSDNRMYIVSCGKKLSEKKNEYYSFKIICK